MRQVILVTAVIAAVTLCAGPALAADPAAEAVAQARYDEAMVAYQAGRFAEAAEGFEKAYDALDHAALLWNIGRSWEQAGELEKARDRYTKFLGHEDVDSDLRVKVADALVRVGGKLQARKDAKTQDEKVAQLEKEIREAETERNAELIRKLRVQLEQEEQARVADAAKAQAEAEAREAEASRRAGPAEGPMSTQKTYEPARSGPSPVAWVALGVGAAAAGVGTWMLLSAEGKRDDVKKAMSGAQQGFVTSMSLAEARTLESDANRNAKIGVASVAVGGALAVTGVVLAITTRGKAEPAVALGAAPRRGGAVLTASGRF